MSAPTAPGGRDAIPEEELHAFVDGQLSPERRDEVALWLEGEPEVAARVHAWQAQRNALRAAFAEPAPPAPSLDLMRIVETRMRRRRMLPWAIGAAAAAIVLALGLGGAAGWMLRGGPADRQAMALSVLEQEAFATHAVYSVDKRHPIEVGAAERAHLTQWLSNRLNRRVAPPDLSAAGWHLLGGRLLATERGGAAALFMYDNPQGQRLSVVMRPMAPDLATPEPQRMGGAVNGSAWIIGGLGYAVVAAAPQDEISEVSKLVRPQSPAA
jgi:anti-sigma factor RsiW